MITPLAQRQMFQTINAEAVKAALEVSGLIQRETAQRQAMLDRMAEDQASVPTIPKAEDLRTEERKGGRQDEGAPGPGRRRGPGAGRGGPGKANVADAHVDLLA